MFHVDFEREGPGLLLRDIESGEDPQIAAAVSIIAESDPDVLLLLGFDYDAENLALAAFAAQLAEAGPRYSNYLAFRPNSGLRTGADIDGDGYWAEPEDSQGYAAFAGQGGMALLSKFPIQIDASEDFSSLLWRDVAGADLTGVMSEEAAAAIRLFGVAAWQVPIETENGPLHLIAVHADAPVFDGPEDRNGLRNADQLRHVMRVLDRSQSPISVFGTLNVDPMRGEGRQHVLRQLLQHRAVQDPLPQRPNGRLETVDWDDPTPGDLRVDYILPAREFSVLESGVLWPEGETEAARLAETASTHRLIYVDIDF